jgi:hypothetical protein
MAQKNYVQSVTIATEVKEGAAKVTVSIKVKSGDSSLATNLKNALENTVRVTIEENDSVDPQ